MHFVNRNNAINPPIEKLEVLNVAYKDKWIAYKLAKENGTHPLPTKPPSSWLGDDIRIPLRNLFLLTCGYCGIHTKIGSDGEVDHHLPIDKDINSDHILNWDNYIWSCHSCNNMKRNNYPFLNPCLVYDMKHIYFHSSSGKYLYTKESPSDIIEKFEITDKHSNINYSYRCKRRKLIYRDVTENYLSRLKIAFYSYQIECNTKGEDSQEAKNKLEIFNNRKKSFLELIDCGDYLFLIEYAFYSFCEEHDIVFPFTFDNLLIELGIKSEEILGD